MSQAHQSYQVRRARVDILLKLLRQELRDLDRRAEGTFSWGYDGTARDLEEKLSHAVIMLRGPRQEAPAYRLLCEEVDAAL